MLSNLMVCAAFSSSLGADVNILAELLSGLPNLPPPSLLKSSPLGLLLMVKFIAALSSLFTTSLTVEYFTGPPKPSHGFCEYCSY